MKKQRHLLVAACLVLIILATGCGDSVKKNSSGLDQQQSGAGPSVTETSSAEDTSKAGQDSPPVQKPDLNEIDVDITEKMYVTYINEIYVNTEDYLGNVIRIEGKFKAYTDENTGSTYYYVYRTGPGCCGNDGAMCGFEFTWSETLPKDDDWIEVVGTLRSYEEDGWEYLTLDAKSVTVMETRGAETVYQ